jgi:adenylate kinase
MARIVIVTGTPGAGKSSIVRTLDKSPVYRVRNLGEIMLGLAIKKGYCKDRDKIRYLSNAKQNELGLAAARQLAKEKGTVVLDTHASVEQHGRVVTGLPGNFLDALKDVRGLVYVDSETDLIVKRRKRDKARSREVESKRTIETQRIINLSTLSYCAAYLNIPIYIIDNKEGRLKESQNSLRLYLKDALQ